jgi:transcriptional regulator with XRE-family HTH domain
MGSEDVARRIQLARLGRGWSQADLGEKLGRYSDRESARNGVKQIETGRGVSRTLVSDLARVLAVSESYLLTGNTLASDIDVIVEGAKQDGWDHAITAMRSAIEALKRQDEDSGLEGVKTPPKRAVAHEVETPPKRQRRGA